MQLTPEQRKMSRGERIKRDFKKNRLIYLMLVPILLYYILFSFQPMYGAIIAFKEFTPAKGILGSPWVGFKHFKDFFQDIYFKRILRNTLRISIYSILFNFPAPILLALLLNELTSERFKRGIQTISYMPHFISMVVVAGMIKDFTMDDGIITYIFSLFGREPTTMLMDPKLFVPIYIISGIWQGVGWGAIIYIAAIAGVDQELYDAAKIDGAGRFNQAIHITLPGIRSTIIMLLIMRVGSILSVGFEKIILLYNPGIYETADVISSYIYRLGLQQMNWSYSTAVGLFNSIVNFVMVALANALSRHYTETSLW